ncbi:O-antigen ligase family protein, partial [filamentous cyanobacterium LEGE 11480]
SALSAGAFSHFVFGLLFPAYAQHVMYWSGAWRGLMTHKNSLAQLSVLGALVIQMVLPFHYRHKRWLWAGLATCVMLVLLSTSKTGFVLLLLLSLLLPILRSLRVNRIEAKLAVVTMFLFILTLIAAFVGNYELILTSLGRDPTLTGRTDIWAVLLEKASKHIWFGYGFEVFWSGGMDGEAVDLWYVNRYIVDTAHNGFLDILLELGIVGLGIFLASVVMNFLRGLQWLSGTRSPEGLYPLVVMAYWIVYNLSESTVPTPYSINWILFVSVATSMLIYRLPGRRAIAHNQPRQRLHTTYEALPAHPDS